MFVISCSSSSRREVLKHSVSIGWVYVFECLFIDMVPRRHHSSQFSHTVSYSYFIFERLILCTHKVGKARVWHFWAMMFTVQQFSRSISADITRLMCSLAERKTLYFDIFDNTRLICDQRLDIVFCMYFVCEASPIRTSLFVAQSLIGTPVSLCIRHRPSYLGGFLRKNIKYFCLLIWFLLYNYA